MKKVADRALQIFFCATDPNCLLQQRLGMFPSQTGTINFVLKRPIFRRHARLESGRAPAPLYPVPAFPLSSSRLY